jgi:hypothetical protein
MHGQQNINIIDNIILQSNTPDLEKIRSPTQEYLFIEKWLLVFRKKMARGKA